MKDSEKESALKKFIKDAFTSEAKAARIPYYFFAICVLLAVICIQLNTANRYLKKIASGDVPYKYETNSENNDPFNVFTQESTTNFSDKYLSETSSSETVQITESETNSLSQTNSITDENVTQNQNSTTTTTSAPPQGTTRTYVINKNSKKIHYSTCGYAKNMKEENKLVVNITPEQLKNDYLSAGYTFCSKCG